jgi:hypothetical protein
MDLGMIEKHLQSWPRHGLVAGRPAILNNAGIGDDDIRTEDFTGY